MRYDTLLASLLAVLPVAAASEFQPPKDWVGWNRKLGSDSLQANKAQQDSAKPDSTKATGFLMPQTPETEKYAVNGTGIPDVDFDVGESYAGLMPIGNDTSRSLFFWMFPTANDKGKDTVTIWLNGGPYCSSLAYGLLQETGPFTWPPGVGKPMKNTQSWHLLTNIIYVDQPVGTGFAQGDATKTRNEADLARDFLEFFRNLVDTFELHGKKIYIAGESYAGVYIPNIAYAMFEANDTEYLNLQGTLIYDGAIGSFDVNLEMHVVPYIDRFSEVFRLNETYLADIRARHKSCGWEKYIEDNFKFPPAGPFPDLPDVPDSCRYWSDTVDAMLAVRPCFNAYQILSVCPVGIDVVSPDPREGYDGPAYFARSDVQEAIHAPAIAWEACGNAADVYGLDEDDPYGDVSWFLYPNVIERSARTVYVHGSYDFRIIDDGVLMVFQNMTWGGAQGFTERPSDKFYVPYNGYTQDNIPFPLPGWGEMGVTRTERGLTWISQWGAGHEVPQFVPGAASLHLEYLLGMVDDITCVR